MAVAFKTALGTGVSAASGTTLTITTTAAIAIDDLVVVRVAADNLNATTPTFTCADGGNTYTVHKFQGQNATAAGGVTGAILATKATVARPSGSTITITLSGAVVNKSAYAESFTGAENTVRSTAVSAAGATGNAASPASGTVNAGDLVLGAAMVETRTNSTGDADTTNGSWSTITQIASGASAGDATRVLASGQYKIATASGAQSYGTTNTSTDWVAMCVVLQETFVAPPAITQAAYQFFDEVGTESGAASLAAQNTAVTGNLGNGDGWGLIRVRLQSTTAVAVPATDDFQLQWEKNASGSWTNVGTGAVIGYNAPSLTEGQATTNRLGAGTGSFVAGKVSEDGVVDDLGWSASNYTEVLYSVKLLAAQLAHGDTLRFRVLRNGVTTEMTYTQTPTVNIVNLSQTWVGSTGGVGVAGVSGSFSETAPIPPPTIGKYLDPSIGTASTPDPGVFPDPAIFVFAVIGPTGAGSCTVCAQALSSGGADNGYAVRRFEQGNTNIIFSVDGTDWGPQFLGIHPGATGNMEWIAVSMQSAGAGFSALWTSTNGVSWNQIDSDTAGAGLPFWNSSLPVTIGLNAMYGNDFIGQIYLAELRTGLNPASGTVLWRFNANDHVSGTTWTDEIGNVWTVTDADAIKIPVGPVGGKPKVWNGSAWVEKPIKVWTGSAWVEKPLKVWTGSSWVLA